MSIVTDATKFKRFTHISVLTLLDFASTINYKISTEIYRTDVFIPSLWPTLKQYGLSDQKSAIKIQKKTFQNIR